MFVPGKPLQPSLMFVGKAGARDKHSNLLRKSVNYGRKSFIVQAPGVFVKSLYNLVQYFQVWAGAYPQIGSSLT